jgi:cbb3-type cytochrome oxidase subunit 3
LPAIATLVLSIVLLAAYLVVVWAIRTQKRTIPIFEANQMAEIG